jgi:hypothetical protein
MYGVRRQTRANLPRRYVFSVVKLAPPSTATADGPCSSCTRLMARAVVAMASS